MRISTLAGSCVNGIASISTEAVAHARAARTLIDRGANATVVRGYLKWRAQLSACGCKFVREDAAEEGVAALALLLRTSDDARVDRITAIFNLARYGGEELAAADAEEFAALTKAVPKKCVQRRRVCLTAL